MSKEVTVVDTFKQQMGSATVQTTLQEFIPDDTMMRRFTAVTIRAVQEKPELLEADRKSLFLACQRAAQDGLMPDGREGAFVVYNTNVGTKQKPKWEKKVQYQPMIQGIRKRLAKIGWSMAAELRYANDEFSYELGDNPHIFHKPYLEGPRGEMVGAYAIATNLNTGDKYREYMPADVLERIRASSKNPNGGPWASFPEEMHRKSPAKRLLKYLPLDETDIFDMISRDNEQFDLNQPASVSETAKKVQEAARAASAAPEPPEPIEGELVDPEPEKKPATKKAAAKKAVEAETEPDMGPEPPPIEEVDPLGF